MKRQLTGFGWMFFGLLLYIVMKDVWIPVIGDNIWIVSLLCGIAGLAAVILGGGSDAE